MIRLESGILVLDAPISKEDAEAVGEFAKHVRQQEQERIKINIMDRVTDLKTCGKDDNCWEFGDLIESYIEEWTDEANLS